MSPEEKAKQLYRKYKKELRADNRSWEHESMSCALACIDEIKREIKVIEFEIDLILRSNIEYWNKVEHELINYKSWK